MQQLRLCFCELGLGAELLKVSGVYKAEVNPGSVKVIGTNNEQPTELPLIGHVCTE
jgi:hypothetical protein